MPSALPLSTFFDCTATLTTDYEGGKGPFVQQLSIPVTFNPSRDRMVVTSFPTITTESYIVQTPFGDRPNTTTVTGEGEEEGTFNQATGQLDITVKLHFNHSIPLAGGSTISIPLSTNGSVETITGSPVDNIGTATLVGTGIFDGGVLAKHQGMLGLSGKFRDIP